MLQHEGVSESKQCFKCEQYKPRSEFYAHPMMGDGLLGKCKACTKTDVRNNYSAKRERYSIYDRARAKTEKRRTQTANSIRRMRRAHPEKMKAYNAVARAVRAGRLIRQPCEVCGATKVQAHHHDYSKPLDVQWLCFRCHREHAHGQVVTATDYS